MAWSTYIGVSPTLLNRLKLKYILLWNITRRTSTTRDWQLLFKVVALWLFSYRNQIKEEPAKCDGSGGASLNEVIIKAQYLFKKSIGGLKWHGMGPPRQTRWSLTSPLLTIIKTQYLLKKSIEGLKWHKLGPPRQTRRSLTLPFSTLKRYLLRKRT